MNGRASTVLAFRRPPPLPISAGEPTVSVIVPVVADNEALHRLLVDLRRIDQPADEIVIVDGGASTRCRSLARRHGCIYVATRPGRGHQLHAGALRASGDVLWFLPADSSPPDDGISLIRRAYVSGAAGGHFGFRFAGGPAWHKSTLARLINWRVRFGVPYGDQGLFASRTAYDAMGGFPDLPLFEDVELVRGLRRVGQFVRLPADMGVSPRRWERDGWLTRALLNRILALAFLAGVSPRRLAKTYRPLDHLDAG